MMGSADHIRGYDEIIRKETDAVLKPVELCIQKCGSLFEQ